MGDSMERWKSRRWTVLLIIWVVSETVGAARAEDRKHVAEEISRSERVTLAKTHASGQVDQAGARQNVLDAAAGKQARRSNYENAPGGAVSLESRMLAGMNALASGFTFRVSEIAGGSRSANSRHYAGLAFDMDQIDGKPVSNSNRSVNVFMQKCRKLGVTEVHGPGNPGHDGHVHAAWPRPSLGVG